MRPVQCRRCVAARSPATSLRVQCVFHGLSTEDVTHDDDDDDDDDVGAS